MADEDWSTVEGLREIARVRAAAIPGWRAPTGFAVGYRAGDEWVFPHVNKPGSPAGLTVVVLAEVTGYVSGTREYRLTAAQLADAIANLAPAEAATGIAHPNLAAWRAVAAARPAEIVAVFVGDRDDPATGPADTALRAMW